MMIYVQKHKLRIINMSTSVLLLIFKYYINNMKWIGTQELSLILEMLSIKLYNYRLDL